MARRQPGEAPYPEPAFASAQRMKRRTGSTSTTTATKGEAGAAAANDPAQAVLARAQKRITSSARKR